MTHESLKTARAINSYNTRPNTTENCIINYPKNCFNYPTDFGYVIKLYPLLWYKKSRVSFNNPPLFNRLEDKTSQNVHMLKSYQV